MVQCVHVIRRPALMELFLLVAFHCISTCLNYCFVFIVENKKKSTVYILMCN